MGENKQLKEYIMECATAFLVLLAYSSGESDFMAETDVIQPLMPFVTFSLIIFNVFIYILSFINRSFILVFALVPSVVLQGQALYTLITSMFLHADPVHLFMNMFFLYLFGPPIERQLNPIIYIAFFLFSGIIGSLGHVLLTVTLESIFYPLAPFIPTLGASGAIFGILAAHVYLIPRRRISTWTGYEDAGRTITNWNFIIIYFIFEVFFAVLSFGSGIAHGAHVFGFVGGFLFAYIFWHLKQRFEKRKEEYETSTSSYYT